MKVPVLLGGIAGDVIGSKYESFNTRRTDFRLFGRWSRFTDDTVLTVAIADALMSGVPYEVRLREYALRYPDAGYGDMFMAWVHQKGTAGDVVSYAAGAAMRVPPLAYWFNSMEEVSAAADASALATHPSGEGFVSAGQMARIIYRVRSLGSGKRSQSTKLQVLDSDVVIDPSVSISQLNRPHDMDFHASTVLSHAASAFYHGTAYEDVLRLAISIGGDSDTIACMAGAMAYPFYRDMPEDIYSGVMERLPSDFVTVLNRFDNTLQARSSK